MASLSRPFPGKPENQTIYTYEYNAAGQRTSKTKTYSTTGESITTEFIYEGDLLVGQKTSDGKGDMTFLHDDTGAYIGLIYEGVEYYYMKNVQGDIIGIVDAEGVIQAVYTYEPFGKLFSIETKSGFLRYDGDWSVGGMNPIRYRGYYYDYDTKLYYLNSRYYDPYVGRFLNADSQVSGVDGDIRGYNLFSYCFNNPINLSDDSGSWPNWATKLIAAVAVVAVVTVVAAVTVATAGAGTAIAAVAVGAAKGAAIGFAVGAATGAASGAIKHCVSTGSWKGAGSAALNGMANGALSGSISGAITGGITGGLNYNSGTSSAGKGFDTFRQLKKEIGSPGTGNEWHHIVEQSQIKKSGFSPQMIQNTNNIISISKTTHRAISGYYSSIQPFTNGMVVRDWLATQSFSEQYEFGLNVIKMFM